MGGSSFVSSASALAGPMPVMRVSSMSLSDERVRAIPGPMLRPAQESAAEPRSPSAMKLRTKVRVFLVLVLSLAGFAVYEASPASAVCGGGEPGEACYCPGTIHTPKKDITL